MGSSVQVVRGGYGLVGAARGRDTATRNVIVGCRRTTAGAGGVPRLLGPVLVPIFVPLLVLSFLALVSTKMTAEEKE